MAGWRGSFGSAADRIGSAAKRASGAAAICIPTALKGVAGGAAGGAVVGGGVAAAEGVALNALGFTALGPAAGSYAAGWMSSIAPANGVGVSAGSTYAAAQSATMGGSALLGGPFVIACVVVGGVAMTVRQYRRGRGGDAPAPDDSTKEELSLEEDVTEGDQQSDELLGE